MKRVQKGWNRFLLGLWLCCSLAVFAAACDSAESKPGGTSGGQDSRIPVIELQDAGGTELPDTATCVATAPEDLCDGQDNDCDGELDEDFQPEECGVAECRKQSSCVGGVVFPCSNLNPSEEICDGKDNDCDGETDEDIPDQICGFGWCQRLVKGCIEGAVPECLPGEPPEPPYDCSKGYDYDCDGAIDQCGPCAPGDVRPCYTGYPPETAGVGECREGSQICEDVPENEPVFGACQGDTLPVPEICDGRDNDCNRANDDGLPLLGCGDGICHREIASCVDGVQQQCVAGTPGERVCNGQDNDCDGVVDDEQVAGCCTPGAMRSCAGSSMGVCKTGMEVCGPAGDWSGICVGRQESSPEICDNQDNDCDGETDEDLTRDCQWSCGNKGKQSCQAGVWGECSAEPCPCQPGQTSKQPCGFCGEQTRTCGSGGDWGAWPACQGEGTCAPGSSEEQECGDCGAQRRYCNVSCQWDSWQNCADPGANSCGGCTALLHQVGGICGACGLYECSGEDAVTCSDPGYNACHLCGPLPAEVCNDRDDNCDGTGDEGLQLNCPSGATCRSGQCCTPTTCADKCGGASDGCGGTCTTSCGSGKTCQSQACVSCGAWGQPCCDGNSCTQGTCQSGTCSHSQGGCTTDSYGIKWLCIPAGTYQMGCSTGDTACGNEETPPHQVSVMAFKMTETEVTQGQYQTVIGSNPSVFSSCGGTCPVEYVRWSQAKAFCQAVGGRLPSEAEWEYAARAGTTTKYYCGDSESCLGGIAWYDANSSSTTHAVKGKTANAFGLYDMLGNVWEWVEDCWHADYTGAPSTSGVWTGGDCTSRVLRGGSWNTNAWSAPASYRFYYASTNDTIGFRCSRD